MSRPKVDAARKVAYDVLKAVRLDGAYANLVLPELLRRADLDVRRDHRRLPDQAAPGGQGA